MGACAQPACAAPIDEDMRRSKRQRRPTAKAAARQGDPSGAQEVDLKACEVLHDDESGDFCCPDLNPPAAAGTLAPPGAQGCPATAGVPAPAAAEQCQVPRKVLTGRWWADSAAGQILAMHGRHPGCSASMLPAWMPQQCSAKAVLAVPRGRDEEPLPSAADACTSSAALPGSSVEPEVGSLPKEGGCEDQGEGTASLAAQGLATAEDEEGKAEEAAACKALLQAARMEGCVLVHAGESCLRRHGQRC